MTDLNVLKEPDLFSIDLYDKMEKINPGIADLELYEFRYCLENWIPEQGWNSISLDKMDAIESQIHDSNFYQSIQLKPRQGNRLVMDQKIVRLSRMLFVGLVTGKYPMEWITKNFYFDIRGFYFLHKTEYFNKKIREHLKGKPYKSFEQKQKQFGSVQSIGYKAFQAANDEIDQYFIELVQKLVILKGTPILIAIAGQTAAGKTEIVSRLRSSLEQAGKKVTAIEMDNFLTDRDYREEKGIDSLGKEALHYEIFKQCLGDICSGEKITTPRYDFVKATSSHDLNGKLKEGCTPIEIEPADIIFMEGNFPFLLPEIAHLIGIKAVYLTDDEIRLKRKWKRDMDYRKKYELMYFLNRYFREQFLMAETAYIPQMEMSDMVVHTTSGQMWLTSEIAGILQCH